MKLSSILEGHIKVDPIVNAVLDQLVRMIEIDAAWIDPDMNFHSALEVSSEQIVILGALTLRSLGHEHDIRFNEKFVKCKTPRELVTVIKQIVPAESYSQAA